MTVNTFWHRAPTPPSLASGGAKGRGNRARRSVAMLTAVAVAAAHLPARAQEKDAAQALPLIRDAEIEQLLRDYTAPILRAAGLAQQNVHIVIINDRAFNAFVVDGRRIFVNVGALLDAKTPNEIIGVLAHETGHIAGGHLSKLREPRDLQDRGRVVAHQLFDLRVADDRQAVGRRRLRGDWLLAEQESRGGQDRERARCWPRAARPARCPSVHPGS